MGSLSDSFFATLPDDGTAQSLMRHQAKRRLV
jgi:hypothetical protein